MTIIDSKMVNPSENAKRDPVAIFLIQLRNDTFFTTGLSAMFPVIPTVLQTSPGIYLTLSHIFRRITVTENK